MNFLKARSEVELEKLPKYAHAVIELSGVLGVQPPPVHFSTPPDYSQKITLGVRLNPPEQRSVTQCILFSACIQRFSTLVSFRMIRSSDCYDSLVDYLLIYFNRSHLRMFYFCTSMPYRLLCIILRLYCGSLEIKSSNAAECYTGWHKINGTTS